MCIVNYIPLGNDSFALTHSRDESIKRPLASSPLLKEINGQKHVFPIDPLGKGTWIGMSENGRVACILNGSDEWHKHDPPYRHSRGLIIPAYFSSSSFYEFFRNYNFEGLEPFTLVVFEQQKIYIGTFDGTESAIKILDKSKAFLLTSAKLYSQESTLDKKLKFNNWWDTYPKVTYSEIVNHNLKWRYENELDKSLTNGHPVQTVSLTAIYYNPKKTRMDYYDLVNDIHLDRELKQRPVKVL